MVVLDNFCSGCYGKQTRETLQTEHATERVLENPKARMAKKEG
jgi:hypothetical protein